VTYGPISEEADALIKVCIAWNAQVRKQPWAASSLSCAMLRNHEAYSLTLEARRNFAKARSVVMNLANIGPISFAGSTATWPVSCASA
jgi:hypothetical protein